MDIKDGLPVIRPKLATRLATASQPPVEHPTTAVWLVPSFPVKQDKKSLFRRIFQPTPKRKTVSCYHCHQPFEITSLAQSSHCPKCGGHISLRDYEVDHARRRRIQTRGDVLILKQGSIIGVNVQCHNLTVLGKLEATVECSGVLRIRSHGKIIGSVHCGELRVERGAMVEFQGDVHARSAYIDGKLRAQLTCDGTITLEKRAHLQGLARAGALVVKEGAKHTGLMEVIQAKKE